MNASSGFKRFCEALKVLRPTWILLLVWAAVLLFFFYRGHYPTFQNVPGVMAQKLEMLAALRTLLYQSVEAEKLAVMAETDEASLEYAHASRQAAEGVDAALEELLTLIGMNSYADQQKIAMEFRDAWEKVREIDHEILGQAVRNTNLKAFRLSFGKGRETQEYFEKMLFEVSRISNDARLIRAAGDAMAAELKILSLQAPHIASADSGEMDRIERIIQEKENIVTHSLEALVQLTPGDKQGDLRQAISSNRDFVSLTAEILRLSRQNTDVESLNSSLYQKKKATALCETLLNQLHEAIKGQTFKATK